MKSLNKQQYREYVDLGKNREGCSEMTSVETPDLEASENIWNNFFWSE